MGGSNEKLVKLRTCVCRTQDLAGLVGYSDDSIFSKTILGKPASMVILFAFDVGQRLSEHTAQYDTIVQVVDGHGRLIIGGKENDVAAGEIIIMPADVPHAVIAQERFKMLLYDDTCVMDCYFKT